VFDLAFRRESSGNKASEVQRNMSFLHSLDFCAPLCQDKGAEKKWFL
jgi:hypothetical protein